MNRSIQEVLQAISDVAAGVSPAQFAHVKSSLAAAPRQQFNALIDALLVENPPATAPVDDFLSTLFTSCCQAPPATILDSEAACDTLRISKMYKHLRSFPKSTASLLQYLAAAKTDDALRVLADLIVDDPPRDPTHAAVALSPLFLSLDYNPQALFPRLLDGLQNASTAGCVLDLTNYLTREEMVPQHPAAAQRDQLEKFLSGIVGQLAELEKFPQNTSATAEQLKAQVDHSISLAVSICDALALIGDVSAVGKLYQAVELRHRRLRTEAAAALARLGEEEGAAILAALAAEPVARLRVLSYADEMGIAERIAAEYQTPQARAEAQLALWLAQPANVGIPPTTMELVECDQLYWPSFDEPVECYLFRFTYQFEQGEFSNIGIAGPLTHAFGADLGDLPPDDIYAAFAGWQAEHEDIYEIPAQQFTEGLRVEVSRFERRLHDAGFGHVQPVLLGSFFGDLYLIAAATQDGQPGIGLADSDDAFWWPSRPGQRSLGAFEISCIYKGRKLLRSFNP